MKDGSARSEAEDRIARRYDTVPYTNFPYAVMQPGRLAALAELHGLAPAPVPTARVLEIGCASGGHLIPLAMALPQAHFLGIDISSQQVATGQARIARLGLGNIELRCASVTEIEASVGQFDFITCHGVYSWVPDTVRAAIMRVMSGCLASNGVGHISFNVLPGWRMFQIVRDTMLIAAGGDRPHAERIGMLEEVFEAFGRHTAENTSYGRIWRDEAMRLARLPPNYLEHELFETDNNPCTFREFMAAASGAGLAYLSDANLSLLLPATLDLAETGLMQRFVGEDPLALEQFVDLISGRTFRHSLLVKDEHRGRIDHTLDASALPRLHLAIVKGFRIVEDGDDFTFDDGHGTIVGTEDPHVREALRRIAKRRPATSRLADLLPGRPLDDPGFDAVSSMVMELILRGVITVSTVPVDCATEVPVRPRIHPLVASDAVSGHDVTTSLSHEPYRFSEATRILLPLMDGARPADDLAMLLLERISTMDLVLRDTAGQPVSGEANLLEAARTMARRCIEDAQRSALLLPA